MVLQHLNGDKVLVCLLQGRREARKLCLDHLEVDLLLLTELLVPIVVIILLVRLVKVRHVQYLQRSNRY